MLELNVSQGQIQSTYPQMIQTLEIIQMGKQELLEYLHKEIQENPILDADESKLDGNWDEIISQTMSWLDKKRVRYDQYSHEEAWDDWCDESRYGGSTSDEEKTLLEHLTQQIRNMDLEKDVYDIVLFLVGSLNEYGRLDEPLEQLGQECGCTQREMQYALKIVQSLEPAGVGGRNLRECLQLQIVRRFPQDWLACRIVQDHLEDLAKHHYRNIAKQVKVSLNEVRSACDRIRALDPRPGSGFRMKTSSLYVVPDVVVEQEGNGLVGCCKQRRPYPNTENQRLLLSDA